MSFLHSPVYEAWDTESAEVVVSGAQNVDALLGALAMPVKPPVGTEDTDGASLHIAATIEAIQSRVGQRDEENRPVLAFTRDEASVVLLALAQHGIYQNDPQARKEGPVKRWLSARRVGRLITSITLIANRPPLGSLTPEQVRRLP